MSKQINLLGQVAEAPELSAQRVLLALGVMFIAYIGYSGIAWLRVAQLAGTAAQSDAVLQAERAKVKALEQKLGARPKLADIVAEINGLKAQTAESQEILSLLRGGPGASEGYSGQLTTLARISEDGVWLNGVSFLANGKTVNIKGQSLRSESVLRYAQRLNEQFSAYGVQFSAVEMTPELAKAGPGVAAPSAYGFRLY